MMDKTHLLSRMKTPVSLFYPHSQRTEETGMGVWEFGQSSLKTSFDCLIKVETLFRRCLTMLMYFFRVIIAKLSE